MPLDGVKGFTIPVQWKKWVGGSTALRYLVWKECKRRNIRLHNENAVRMVAAEIRYNLR